MRGLGRALRLSLKKAFPPIKNCSLSSCQSSLDFSTLCSDLPPITISSSTIHHVSGKIMSHCVVSQGVSLLSVLQYLSLLTPLALFSLPPCRKQNLSPQGQGVCLLQYSSPERINACRQRRCLKRVCRARNGEMGRQEEGISSKPTAIVPFYSAGVSFSRFSLLTCLLR